MFRSIRSGLTIRKNGTTASANSLLLSRKNHKTAESYDVVIIVGGPVGLALACALREGIQHAIFALKAFVLTLLSRGFGNC